MTRLIVQNSLADGQFLGISRASRVKGEGRVDTVVLIN
jgi:hypothetical protein